MKSRMSWIISAIGALAWLLAPGETRAADGPSVCNSQPDVFVTTVDRTFAAGSRWRFNVLRRECEGLTFAGVFYQPAGGTLRKVLDRANIAEVHVPYLQGSPRFLDVTDSTRGLGNTGNAVALSEAECLGGTRSDGNRICIANEVETYGWKVRTSFRRRENVTVFMSSQLGAYNYINKWIFHDDGTIEPQLGLTGRLQIVNTGSAFLPYGSRLNPESEPNPRVGMSHWHNVYYRLDFDINGAANDRVERLTFQGSMAPSPEGVSCSTVGECGTNVLSPIVSEAAQNFSPLEHSTWLIADKVTQNGDGRRIGYELAPSITGLWRGMTTSTEPWSANDLWVTRFRGCEILAAGNHLPHIPSTCGTPAGHVTAMVNGESVDGVDVVVWYTNRMLHIPRDEDELNMPIEWMSFEIRPRSFHRSNPAPTSGPQTGSPDTSEEPEEPEEIKVDPPEPDGAQDGESR